MVNDSIPKAFLFLRVIASNPCSSHNLATRVISLAVTGQFCQGRWLWWRKKTPRHPTLTAPLLRWPNMTPAIIITWFGHDLPTVVQRKSSLMIPLLKSLVHCMCNSTSLAYLLHPRYRTVPYHPLGYILIPSGWTLCLSG